MSREDKELTTPNETYPGAVTTPPEQGLLWSLKTKDFNRMSKLYYLSTKIPRISATKIKIEDKEEWKPEWKLD